MAEAAGITYDSLLNIGAPIELSSFTQTIRNACMSYITHLTEYDFSRLNPQFPSYYEDFAKNAKDPQLGKWYDSNKFIEDLDSVISSFTSFVKSKNNIIVAEDNKDFVISCFWMTRRLCLQLYKHTSDSAAVSCFGLFDNSYWKSDYNLNYDAYHTAANYQINTWFNNGGLIIKKKIDNAISNMFVLNKGLLYKRECGALGSYKGIDQTVDHISLNPWTYFDVQSASYAWSKKLEQFYSKNKKQYPTGRLVKSGGFPNEWHAYWIVTNQEYKYNPQKKTSGGQEYPLWTKYYP